MTRFPEHILAEAQRLLKEHLLQDPDEGVRLLAEIVETPDDHPTIIAIANQLLLNEQSS